MGWKKPIGQNNFMAQDQTKKEALFNEVKGSLFEYLVAREIAVTGKEELPFQQSLDKNYLTVLSQQDRMIRQFYPEMLPFLTGLSKITAQVVMSYLKEVPTAPRVVGKFSNSSLSEELSEADLVLSLKTSTLPVSLKLNKKNAFVNTKSGGIKSFFSLYFAFIPASVQENFNKFVDLEFNRMAYELHALHDLEYSGDFNQWVKRGLSELPGELDADSRAILKAYYARIAQEMHHILTAAYTSRPDLFQNSLPALMGFGKDNILQVICFHEFPKVENPLIEVHSFEDVRTELRTTVIKPFTQISSVEFSIGNWLLQVRVKPMNKFTTTAIKMNCSVKKDGKYVRPPNAF
jgi:hypothetical protein